MSESSAHSSASENPFFRLGWDNGWQDAWNLDPQLAELVPARISMETKLNYLVCTAEGELPAKITGKLLHETKRTPLSRPKVGDWVGISPIDNGTRAQIRGMLQRRSQLARKVVGRRNEGQVIAANVDSVFIVQGLDDNFNLRRLERCLVMVHEGGALPIVLLNKTDLCSNLAERLTEARSVTGHAPIVCLSAKTGEHVDHLREWIRPGQSVAFIGSSGVGKSTLINRIYGDVVQDTAEVRERDSKGRHTTVRREMIFLPEGGIVIDTPGMREFHLWFADVGLEAAFSDIEEIALRCRFNDCTHVNEPDCAVLSAVEQGELERERHQNYQRLQADLNKLNQAHRRRIWKDKASGSFQKTRASRPHKKGGR
tara:strand:+ start:7130 stop:8239 length:1110 start_codon:yes stop_codon:yes gene_type:complete